MVRVFDFVCLPSSYYFHKKIFKVGWGFVVSQVCIFWRTIYSKVLDSVEEYMFHKVLNFNVGVVHVKDMCDF